MYLMLLTHQPPNNEAKSFKECDTFPTGVVVITGRNMTVLIITLF